MPKQVQTQKQKQKHAEPETDSQPAAVEKDQELEQITDEFLEEIDSVLEQNAEEFVRQYVQKGGELCCGQSLSSW